MANKDKDPALMFYTKDWLEGTADLSADEKGVYIDLICYQHQRGFLPTDTKRLARLVRLSVEEFTKIWEILHAKFTLSDTPSGTVYVNKRVAKEIANRTLSALRKSVLAVYGNWVKQHRGLKKAVLTEIKEAFIADSFFEFEDEVLRKEKINEFLNQFLNDTRANAKRSGSVSPSERTRIEDEDEDGNENINNNKKDSDFEIFWNTYDKKVDRQSCQRHFENLPKSKQSKILESIKPYKGYLEVTGYDQKNPKTFLNQQSWENDYEALTMNYLQKQERVQEKPMQSQGSNRNIAEQVQEEINQI